MTYISYEQAFEDHNYLWSEYGAAEDMTGGYVDQGDLARLLKSPTKATARSCLISQINYWFDAGPDSSGRGKQYDIKDQRLQDIAERYGQENNRFTN